MNSREFWKYLVNNPTGFSLTATLSGTGSATALLYSDKIVVDAAAAQHSKTITLTTPLGFKVLDAYSIHGNGTSSTWQLKNDSTALSDTVTAAASDTDIDRVTELDDAQWEFTKDDDDLVIDIGTAAFTGRIVIDIQPV
jgi:hypothetical protein